MKGFHDGIKAAIPDAKFVTTEENGLNTSYEPGQDLRRLPAFLSANPDVQFIENVDIGAEHADRAIESLGLAGKVFTIGWNVSKGQLDAIEKGIQVAPLDQRWPDQAAFGGPACAQFLKNGVVLPNTQTLKAGHGRPGRCAAQGTRPHPRSAIRLQSSAGRRCEPPSACIAFR